MFWQVKNTYEAVLKIPSWNRPPPYDMPFPKESVIKSSLHEEPLQLTIIELELESVAIKNGIRRTSESNISYSILISGGKIIFVLSL